MPSLGGAQLNSSDRQIIVEHKLQGLLFELFSIDEFKPHWASNRLINLTSLEVYKSLYKVIGGSGSMLPFKGVSLLLRGVYTNYGARPMSDVDLLVAPQGLQKFTAGLKSIGFTQVHQKRWLGDEFKTDYKAHVNLLEIHLEVHTRAFWIEAKGQGLTIDSESQEYKLLDPTLELFYLCVHWSFLNTFEDLLHFYDITLFIEKYSSKIKQKELLVLFKKNKLINSFCAIDIAFKRLGFKCNLFKSKQNNLCLNWFVTKNFLLRPRSSRLKYYVIKFLLFDSKLKAIYYMFCRWIK